MAGDWWPLKLKLLEANYEKCKVKIRQDSLYCKLFIVQLQNAFDEERFITQKYENRAVSERLQLAEKQVAYLESEKEIVVRKAAEDCRTVEGEWKAKTDDLIKRIKALQEEKDAEIMSKDGLISELSKEVEALRRNKKHGQSFSKEMLLSAESGNMQLELTQSRETRIFRNTSGSTATTSSRIEAQGHKPTTLEKTKKVSRKVSGSENDGESSSRKLDNFSGQLDNHENTNYSKKADDYFQKADNCSEKQSTLENLDSGGSENILESDLGCVLEVTEEMLQSSRGRVRKTKSGFDDFAVESSESDTAETNGNQDKKRKERRVTFSDELEVKLPDKSSNVLALENGDDSPLGKNDIQNVKNDVFDDIFARETTAGESCRSKELENNVEKVSGETMHDEVRVQRNVCEVEVGEVDVEYEISGRCVGTADSWKSSSVERVSKRNKITEKSNQNKQEKVVASEVLENGENLSCNESLGKADRKIMKTNRKKGVEVVEEENGNKKNEEGENIKKNRRFSVEADILLSVNRQTRELQLNSDIKETGQKICETPLLVDKVKVNSRKNDSDELQDTGKCEVIHWSKRGLRQKTNKGVKQSKRLLGEFGNELGSEEGRRKETKCDKIKLRKQEKNQDCLNIVKDKFVDPEICEKEQARKEEESSRNELKVVQKTKNNNKSRKNARGKNAVIKCDNKEVKNKRQGRHERKRKKITKEVINQTIQSSGGNDKNGDLEVRVDMKKDSTVQNVSVKYLLSNANKVKVVGKRNDTTEEGEANDALEQDQTMVSQREGAEKEGNYVEDEPTGEMAEIAEQRSDGILKQMRQEENTLVKQTRKILAPVYEVNESDLEQVDSEIFNQSPPGKSRQKSVLLNEGETDGEKESTLNGRKSDDGLDSENCELERETKEISENNSEVPNSYPDSKIVRKVADDAEEYEIHGNIIHEETRKQSGEQNEIDERRQKKKDEDSKHRSAKIFKVDRKEMNNDKNYSNTDKPLTCDKPRKTRLMKRKSPEPDEENYDNEVQVENNEQSKAAINESIRKESKVFNYSRKANLRAMKRKSPELDEGTVQEENDSTQFNGKNDEQIQKLSKSSSYLDKQGESNLRSGKRKSAQAGTMDIDEEIQVQDISTKFDRETIDQTVVNMSENKRETRKVGNDDPNKQGKPNLRSRKRKSLHSVVKNMDNHGIQDENDEVEFVGENGDQIVGVSGNERVAKVGSDSDEIEQRKTNLRSRKRKLPESNANNMENHGIQDEVEFHGVNGNQVEEGISGNKRKTKDGSDSDEMEQRKSNLGSRKTKSPEPDKQNIDDGFLGNDVEVEGENGHQDMEENSKSNKEKSKKVSNHSKNINLKSRNGKSRSVDNESQRDNNGLELDEGNDDQNEEGLCNEEKMKLGKTKNTETRRKGNIRLRKRKPVEKEMEQKNDSIGETEFGKIKSKTDGSMKTNMKQKRGKHIITRKVNKDESENDEVECEGEVEKVDEESKENIRKKINTRSKKRDLTKTGENDENEVENMDRNKVRRSIKKADEVADKNYVEKTVKKKRRTLYSMRETSTVMNTTSSIFQETLPFNQTRNSTGMPANLSAFMKAFIVPKLRKK